MITSATKLLVLVPIFSSEFKLSGSHSQLKSVSWRDPFIQSGMRADMVPGRAVHAQGCIQFPRIHNTLYMTSRFYSYNIVYYNITRNNIVFTMRREIPSGNLIVI